MHFFRRHLRFILPVMTTVLLLTLTWSQLADMHLHQTSGNSTHLHAGIAPGHFDHHDQHHDGEAIQVDLGATGITSQHLSAPDMPALPLTLLLLFLLAPARRLIRLPRSTQAARPPPPHTIPPLRAPPLAR